MGNRQRGVALITVLILVATVSILALQLNDVVRFSSKRTINQVDLDQAYLLARSGEELVISQLEQQLVQTSIAKLTSDQKSAGFELADGYIRYQIAVIENCFNVNSLFPGPQQINSHHQFTLLAKNLSVSDQRVKDLIDLLTRRFYSAATDKADIYIQPTLMVTEAQFESIWPEDEALARLRNFLCVKTQDSRNRLNPNSLMEKHAPLFRAVLSNTISQDVALKVIQDKPDEGYENVAAFLAHPQMMFATPAPAAANSFSLESTHFISDVEVSYRNRNLSLSSVLYWNGQSLLRQHAKVEY